MERDSAIREDVQSEGTPAEVAAVETSEKKPSAMDYNPRAAAMAAMIADRHATLTEETGEPVGAKPEATPAPVTEAKEDLSTETQITAQSDDGVLSLEDFKGKKVRMKVDGVEQLVDGSKAFASLQKDEAAEKRLQVAGETQRQAEANLAAANAKLAEANSTQERKAAEKEVEAASEEIDQAATEFADALYGGDSSKAVGLFKQAVKATVDQALKGRATSATPDESSMAARIAPAVKQHIELDSALQALDRDYPEIRKDVGFASLADQERTRLESEGLSRGEAILKAGENIAKKYRFGKYGDAPTDNGRPRDPVVDATTRDAKLAAKKGLDEPTTTSARATTLEPTPKTASDRIREIAASRGQQL